MTRPFAAGPGVLQYRIVQRNTIAADQRVVNRTAFARRLPVELRIAHVGRRMTARALSAAADADLSESAWWVLYELSGTAAGLSLVRVARRTAFSASTVTTATDQLAARGWISRERDGADRRRVIAVITETGRVALQDTLSCAEQIFTADRGRLSPAQWHSLEDLLTQLVPDPAEQTRPPRRAAIR